MGKQTSGSSPPFHDLDLVVGKAVQLVYQHVDLVIYLLDTALPGVALVIQVAFGFGIVPLQLQHLTLLKKDSSRRPRRRFARSESRRGRRFEQFFQ
jgi:hypothetical protein